ncbi:MAG: DNA double-strand break repair nuclease NurA [Candidatus Altiarchaeota archaeon]|nr:DNA double-strand break repair nuclease NurA [Candidatus Altiarchaeota archaeon]
MNDLKVAVSKVSKTLEAMELKRKHLSGAIKKIGNTGFRIGDKTKENIVNAVVKGPVTGRFAGVDGGLLVKGFHGIDLIVTRAVATIFDYEKSKIKKSDYVKTTPKVFEFESGSPSELALVAGLRRMELELLVAIQALEKKPDYLLLDGSIFPHPSTKAAKLTHRRAYLRVIKLYEGLVTKCKDQGCILIGIVEDSRSRYFSNMLHDVIVPNLPPKTRELFPNIQNFRDTALLYDALSYCEKTFTFKLRKVPEINYGKEIYAFYLKTAKYDRPIRVEFVAEDPQSTGQAIAQAVLGLSTFSRYGIPSVIIEADARAKLTRYYMDYIERLLGKVTPLMMRLRREGRPI